MRQSGRTTRIANFVVDQLYTCGKCIATDHVAYDLRGDSFRMLTHLIDKVKEQIRINSNGRLQCNHRIVRLEGTGIPVVYFELIHVGEDNLEFIQIR
jgi:hypothetical protein